MATIFLLTKVQEAQTPAQSKGLVDALTKEFPDSWHDLGHDSYLVATAKPLTTQDVTNLAGIVDAAVGSYLVTNLDSYFGWASGRTWEWIRVMKERDGQA